MSTGKLSFFNFNARSLLNQEKRKTFANLINSLCLDILFITETWLLDSMTGAELYLDNFEFFALKDPED